MKNRFKRHMFLRNNLFELFSHKIDMQMYKLMPLEKQLIEINPSFAFSSNLDLISDKVKQELFKIVFNNSLFPFLEKRVKKIIHRQANNIKDYNYYSNTDIELSNKISVRSHPTHSLVSLDPTESSQSLNPPQISYKNLSDYLRRRFDRLHALSNISKELRLVNIRGFDRCKDILKNLHLAIVFDRCAQLQNLDLLKSIREKMISENQQDTSDKTENKKKQNDKNGKDKNIKQRVSTVIKQKNSQEKTEKTVKTSSSGLEKNDSNLRYKGSVTDEKIIELSKTNRLVRIFSQLINIKDRFFHLEFSEDSLSYIILAFYEYYNIGKINREYLMYYI